MKSIFVLLLVFAQQLYAQTFQYAFTASGDDQGHAVVQTNDGGYAVAGRTSSFGAGGNDLFLIKTDNLGNIQWQKTYGSAGDEDGLSIVLTESPDFGFVLAGLTTSFGSVSADAYIIKVDVSGVLQWSGKYNTASNSEHARGVHIASNGDIIVVGTDNLDFFGSSDAVVMRLDSNGNRLWSKVFGGSLNDHVHGIEELPGGNLIISGSSESFGPGSTAGYVMKLSPNGNVLWDYTYGQSGVTGYNSSVLTNDYQIVLTGLTNDFGNGFQTITTKIDTNGVVIWSKVYGGPAFDRGASIKKVVNSNDYFIAANTESFGNDLKEILMLRISSAGDVIWSETIGTNQDDQLNQWATNTIAATLDGGFAMTGYSDGVFTGGNNALLLKSDGVGQFMCDIANVSAQNVSLIRSDISSSTSNAGDYVFVQSTSMNSNFAQNNPCFCDVTPTFDPIADICQNDTPPVLNNSSLEGISGSWLPATINTSVVGTATYTFTPNGNSCANTSSIQVTIVGVDLPVFNPIGPFCQGDDAPSLPSTSLNNITGTWFPGIINTQDASVQSYTFTPTQNQCALSQFDIDIEVVAVPQISFVISDSVGCSPLTVSFISSSNENWENCLWNFGDLGMSTDCNETEFTFSVPGTYDITLTAQSTLAGCQSTFTDLQSVQVLPEPDAEFSMSDSELLTSNTVVQFVNTSQNYNSFFWDFGSLESPLTESPIYSFPTEVNNYTICLTVFNSFDCSDFTCQQISVKEDFVIYVPNSFTPDGDESNNLFYPVFDVDRVSDFEMRIYNRWGEIIWESFDPNGKWDGSYNDGYVQDGSYIWTIQLKNGGVAQDFVGHVNVFR